MPSADASAGVTEITELVVTRLRSMNSYAPKKCALFLAIGPPSVKVASSASVSGVRAPGVRKNNGADIALRLNR